jgi:predicted HicB family RNase H-like nuclease
MDGKKRGRPKQYHEERKTTAVRLPVSLHERLVQVAAERETSVNHLLVKAATVYLDRLTPLP